ncbi:glucan biosynthesis protein [Hyphomonas pacifica]|nr:glucan biosynthesis protein G [Hyphomonas pacifica]
MSVAALLAACSEPQQNTTMAEADAQPAVLEAETSEEAEAVSPNMADEGVDQRSVLYNLDAESVPQQIDAPAPSPQQPEVVMQGREFGMSDIVDQARRLAASEFQPSPAVPDDAKAMNYDQYRRILPAESDMGWPEDKGRYRFLFDPRGYLFNHEVKINLVNGADVTPKAYDPDLFDFKDLPLSKHTRQTLGFAGVRLLAPINRSGKFDEVLSFKGASFFRALGAGNVYGASARGLGLGTASPEGEEFPFFKEFWIVHPDTADDQVEMFALMDSPSVTGAFRFLVTTGQTTRMDVEATFFPRKEIQRVGLSPLTSMYYFSPHDVVKQATDYRPAVHDSEGLAVHMANGEWAWRPLLNPAELEVSVLTEDQPKGFGLLQRHRKFDDFSDLEAGYHQRPDVWIEPTGEWGEGQLMLVEIPTVNEYNDNIAVFWRPKNSWRAGEAKTISYTMNWGLKPSVMPQVVSVSETRAGKKPGEKRYLFILDYDESPSEYFDDAEMEITTSAGEILNPTLRKHPGDDRYRLSFELDPGSASMAELRTVVHKGETPLTETWLYRWRAK